MRFCEYCGLRLTFTGAYSYHVNGSRFIMRHQCVFLQSMHEHQKDDLRFPYPSSNPDYDRGFIAGLFQGIEMGDFWEDKDELGIIYYHPYLVRSAY